eukprot:scaffold4242_cov28-Prasinocladus_malaysianus.AAC.1
MSRCNWPSMGTKQCSAVLVLAPCIPSVQPGMYLNVDWSDNIDYTLPGLNSYSAWQMGCCVGVIAYSVDISNPVGCKPLGGMRLQLAERLRPIDTSGSRL